MRRLCLIAVVLAFTLSCSSGTGPLPRAKASSAFQEAFAAYIADVQASGEEIHGILVLQHGKVLAEHAWPGHELTEEHGMWSVSKTFTAMAVGLAIEDGLLHLDDPVARFFPDQLPDEPDSLLLRMTVEDLLTMSSGFSKDPIRQLQESETDWVEQILALPVQDEPGTMFRYNSACSYLLSAIVTKQTGQSLSEYLRPRLFEPLGIEGWNWEESPQGISCGGWGLYLKTEEMAKMGQLLLQEGLWHRKRLLPAEWVRTASSRHIDSHPSLGSVVRKNLTVENSDWMQGYGYQIWLCRHNAYRAAGAHGQFILVLPEQDAVIAMTANNGKMQAQLDRIWKHLLPVLKK